MRADTLLSDDERNRKDQLKRKLAAMKARYRGLSDEPQQCPRSPTSPHGSGSPPEQSDDASSWAGATSSRGSESPSEVSDQTDQPKINTEKRKYKCVSKEAEASRKRRAEDRRLLEIPYDEATPEQRAKVQVIMEERAKRAQREISRYHSMSEEEKKEYNRRRTQNSKVKREEKKQQRQSERGAV